LKTRLAEMHFLRGLYYFYLVRTWGPVPLSLEEIKEAKATATPSTEIEIYDAIVADIEHAVANLPLTAPAQYGRAWKAPAEFLLGRCLQQERINHTQKPTTFQGPSQSSRA